MSAEKQHLALKFPGLIVNCSRADLDKALGSLGLRAVSRHMTAIGEVALENLRDKAEGYDEMRDDRDAAIAAKEAAEKHAEIEIENANRMRAVIEAAREAEKLFDPVFGTDCPNGKDFAEWLVKRLRPALRALDAGEAPKPAEPSACPECKHGEYVDVDCALCIEEKDLRSALARAEDACKAKDNRIDDDTATINRLRSEHQDEHGHAPGAKPAAEPKPEAIDEWTNDFVEELRRLHPIIDDPGRLEESIRSGALDNALDAVKRRNARIAELEKLLAAKP